MDTLNFIADYIRARAISYAALIAYTACIVWLVRDYYHRKQIKPRKLNFDQLMKKIEKGEV